MAQQGPELAPTLGLFDAASLGVGAMIGSAIFLVPSTLMRANPSPLSAVLVFAVAGIVSFFGALAYSELGAMFPATGGEYVYLREAWGPRWAFLCGWAYFTVTQTGGTAAIVVGFAALAGSVVPLGAYGEKAAAVGLMIALTALNYVGVRSGATATNFMNVVKLGGIAAMLAASIANPAVPAPDWSWPHGWTAAQFGAALVPCLWAYEGWNFIPFVAGEIHKPQRNLPRALAVSIGIVFAVYCASLWIYFRALPLERIAASSAVASDAAIAQLGIAGGTLVTVTMLCALVGCANASVLSCPRVYYAMAKDRVFFRRFTNVHPAFRTPSTALVWQCGWALVLIVSGSYERLLSYCVFGAWIFYAMAAGGVLVLRRRSPHAVRPFRMPGYPYTTVLFVIVAAGFVVSTLVAEPLTSLAGLALVAAGLPVYSFFRRREAA